MVDFENIQDQNISTLEQILSFSNISKIGEGGLGAVYKATTPEGETVAVKTNSYYGGSLEQSIGSLINEFEVMKKFNSKQISRVKKFIPDPNIKDKAYLVMEYYNGPTLFAKLSEEDFISEKELAHNYHQISLGLKEIHDKKLIHNDIKFANIFTSRYSSDDEGIRDDAIVGDLGLCGKQIKSKTILGTLPFISKEKLEGIVTESSDIYSLGAMLLFSTFYGPNDFVKLETEFQKLKNIGPNYYENLYNILKDKSPEIISELDEDLKFKTNKIEEKYQELVAQKPKIDFLDYIKKINLEKKKLEKKLKKYFENKVEDLAKEKHYVEFLCLNKEYQAEKEEIPFFYCNNIQNMIKEAYPTTDFEIEIYNLINKMICEKEERYGIEEVNDELFKISKFYAKKDVEGRKYLLKENNQKQIQKLKSTKIISGEELRSNPRPYNSLGSQIYDMNGQLIEDLNNQPHNQNHIMPVLYW